ncbi:hypothetical protein ACH47B_20085 [Rhodococcus sp. NPDC019627]|uniref:hypothetical protein n=1 Tax=unclassified Rhodococcus (in: high G+C Gram-positive bacteria) TaxID=192944 RepID=UPI0033CA3B13
MAKADAKRKYAPVSVIREIPLVRSIVAELVDGNVWATDARSGRRNQITDGLTITAGPTVAGEGIVFTSTEDGPQWVHISGGDARDAAADYTAMAGFGSSTMNGLHSRLGAVASAYGAFF